MKKATKFAALAVSLLLSAAIPAQTVWAQTTDYRLGDVNRDGNIDSLDAMLVLQGSLTETQRLAADVNQDNIVDSEDADLILAYKVGNTGTFQKATISLNKTNLSFRAVGESEELVASIKGTSVSSVQWTSSDPSVATVSDGMVIAKKAGTATITATLFNGETAVCLVTVITTTPSKDRWFGVDVSYAQGTVDWSAAAKAPVKNTDHNAHETLSRTLDFAILRAGYGSSMSLDSQGRYEQEDAQFRTNMAGTKRYGVPVGAYHYSYANSTLDAKREALLLTNILQGYDFDYPIFYDVEDSAMLTKDNGTPNSREEVSAIVETFCDYMAGQGYYVALYSFPSFVSQNLTDRVLDKYDMWIAHWPDGGYSASGPSYAHDYTMWQFGSNGQLDGIRTDVDVNVSYVDYPTLLSSAKLNRAQQSQAKSAVISGAAGSLYGNPLIK